MLKLFTVFDSKVGAYLTPMVMRSAPEAMRAFGVAASDTSHEFNRHAEDYTLFEIGEWDESTAQIKMHSTPLSICKAIEVSAAHANHYFANKQYPNNVADLQMAAGSRV